MTLYTYPGSIRGFKCLIAAAFSDKSVKTVEDFKLGETNKTKEFLSKFPNGKVPAFVDGSYTLFESNAIAYYLANEQLRGKGEKDQALVHQWIDFAESEIVPSASTWVFPCLGITQYNKQNTEKAKEVLKKALEVLNQHLNTRTYLVGERITLADITVALSLLQPFQLVFDAAFRQPFGNVLRWFLTLVNQPQFLSVVGEVKLCETMAQFDNKKYAALHGKGDKKEKQPKEKKAPQQQQPKAKKPEPAPQLDDDEPPKKEDKDPFASLPKGNMVMDEWKRMYSNNDTQKVALPWFFEHFDPEAYSVWYCEYKYADELSLIFMTCNLVSGMFQRLDRMRKHAFGSMIVFGEDSKNTIGGLWIWRGHDLAFELSEDLQVDYESYSWKKLDYSAPETKKMIEEFWAWEGGFGGKSFNQGKIFK